LLNQGNQRQEQKRYKQVLRLVRFHGMNCGTLLRK